MSRPNAKHADSLRITTPGSVEKALLKAVGTLPGVAVKWVAAKNGPGTGMLRASGENGNRLSWRAPGSGTFGTAVDCSVDGTYLLEDGEDPDKFLQVQVYNSYLSGGSRDAQLYIKDVFENSISQDDITAAEAAAGNMLTWSMRLYNDGGLIASQVKIWVDAGVSDITISVGAGYSCPTTEATALSIADIAPGGYQRFWIRRTIGAAKGYDPDVLNHLHFSFHE